jgi:hypothetical protein
MSVYVLSTEKNYSIDINNKKIAVPPFAAMTKEAFRPSNHGDPTEL